MKRHRWWGPGWSGQPRPDSRRVRQFSAVQFVQRQFLVFRGQHVLFQFGAEDGQDRRGHLLTNAKGFTLYSFAPDTATKSNCNGSCTHFWPPVKGPATAGPGVTGKLTVITRSDGSKQAAYNGHPLYTYVGDTAPGQDKGNGLNLSGGLWHVIPVSGSAAAATSSSGGGGGY